MKKSRFTEQQITFSLRQAEVGGSIREVCRKMGINEQTFYRWKKKFARTEIAGTWTWLMPKGKSAIGDCTTRPSDPTPPWVIWLPRNSPVYLARPAGPDEARSLTPRLVQKLVQAQFLYLRGAR